MNEQFLFLIRCHERNTESGRAEVYQAAAEGTEDVREVYHDKKLIYEDRKEDLLIYESGNRFEVFTNYSGYIERSVFRKHPAAQEARA